MTEQTVTATYTRRALPHRLVAWAAGHGHTSETRMIEGRLRYIVNGVVLTPDQVGYFMSHDRLEHSIPGEVCDAAEYLPAHETTEPDLPWLCSLPVGHEGDHRTVVDYIQADGVHPVTAHTWAQARAGEPVERRAVDVRAGQEITEVETPDGPWYRVERVNRRSLVLRLDAEDVAAGTLRLPITDSHAVLVRDRAA